MNSVLDNARREAVQEYRSQMSQVIADEQDEALSRKYWEGRRSVPTGRYFLFGTFCGITLFWLTWSYLP